MNSLFTLDTDRIVRMFNANGIKMSLSKAFRVAGYIENIHLERLNEVEGTWFEMGKKAGRKEAETENTEAIERAYARGKMSAERTHAKLIIEATMWAELRFNMENLKTKIACIKRLRTTFSDLTLVDAKHIVEAVSGEGYGIGL